MTRKKNIECALCGKSPLSKNEIGIIKKMYGAKPPKYFCLKCLAQNLNVTEQDILDTIEEYKSQGCVMFE